MFDLKEGTLLVRVARSAVEEFFRKKAPNLQKTKNKKLNEKHGVFATIKKLPEKSLRGCIGIVSPTPVFEAVQQASLSAAFRDPRFPALQNDELETIIFEVSVMTEPSLVLGRNSTEIGEKIKIGRDGLLISNGPYSGLLLPQVPIEQKWDVDEFLRNLCYKGGMTPSFLEDENTKIWKFQCQVFTEIKPNGEIEEIKLSK
jgi:uncharacterized protein (TIGR00296 family)